MKSSRKFQLTFTKPMPIGDGKTVLPTRNSFALIMCTVGHWKNGVMDEEYPSWDSEVMAHSMAAFFFGYGNPVNAVSSNA